MHPVSRAFMAFVRDGDLPYRRLIVNDHIVDEAATRLRKQASMRNAASFLTTLDESTLYQFESVSEDVFRDGKEMFVDWTDLGASFTDFIVAAHMDALEVEHVLTYDRHYDAFDVTTLPYRSHIEGIVMAVICENVIDLQRAHVCGDDKVGERGI